VLFHFAVLLDLGKLLAVLGFEVVPEAGRSAGDEFETVGGLVGRARPISGIKGVALDSEGKEKSMRGEFAPHARNSWSIS